jgi:ankyrin repeat protein
MDKNNDNQLGKSADLTLDKTVFTEDVKLDIRSKNNDLEETGIKNQISIEIVNRVKTMLQSIIYTYKFVISAEEMDTLITVLIEDLSNESAGLKEEFKNIKLDKLRLSAKKISNLLYKQTPQKGLNKEAIKILLQEYKESSFNPISVSYLEYFYNLEPLEQALDNDLFSNFNDTIYDSTYSNQLFFDDYNYIIRVFEGVLTNINDNLTEEQAEEFFTTFEKNQLTKILVQIDEKISPNLGVNNSEKFKPLQEQIKKELIALNIDLKNEKVDDRPLVSHQPLDAIVTEELNTIDYERLLSSIEIVLHQTFLSNTDKGLGGAGAYDQLAENEKKAVDDLVELFKNESKKNIAIEYEEGKKMPDDFIDIFKKNHTAKDQDMNLIGIAILTHGNLQNIAMEIDESEQENNRITTLNNDEKKGRTGVYDDLNENEKKAVALIRAYMNRHPESQDYIMTDENVKKIIKVNLGLESLSIMLIHRLVNLANAKIENPEQGYNSNTAKIMVVNKVHVPNTAQNNVEKFIKKIIVNAIKNYFNPTKDELSILLQLSQGLVNQLVNHFNTLRIRRDSYTTYDDFVKVCFNHYSFREAFENLLFVLTKAIALYEEYVDVYGKYTIENMDLIKLNESNLKNGVKNDDVKIFGDILMHVYNDEELKKRKIAIEVLNSLEYKISLQYYSAANNLLKIKNNMLGYILSFCDYEISQVNSKFKLLYLLTKDKVKLHRESNYALYNQLLQHKNIEKELGENFFRNIFLSLNANDMLFLNENEYFKRFLKISTKFDVNTIPVKIDGYVDLKELISLSDLIATTSFNFQVLTSDPKFTALNPLNHSFEISLKPTKKLTNDLVDSYSVINSTENCLMKIIKVYLALPKSINSIEDYKKQLLNDFSFISGEVKVQYYLTTYKNQIFVPDSSDMILPWLFFYSCKETAEANTLLESLLEDKELKIKINEKNINGSTALMFMSKSLSVMKLLINKGANINAKDNSGMSVLMKFVYSGYYKNIDVFKLLLSQENIDVNAKDNKGKTALIHAIKNNENLEVRYLLNREDIDVNIRDNNGRTALNYAAFSSSLKNIKILFDKNIIDINHKDNKGMTAIMRALDSSRDDVFLFFINDNQHGIDYNVKDNDGKTTLIHAVINRKPKRVKLLLSKEDLKINDSDNNGMTALMHAAKCVFSEIEDFFSETLDTNVNLQDNLGMTALMHAANNRATKNLEFLLREKNIEVNTQDINGNTALIYAARADSNKGLNLLLQNNANPELKNKEGNTIVDYLPSNTKIKNNLEKMYPSLGKKTKRNGK